MHACAFITALGSHTGLRLYNTWDSSDPKINFRDLPPFKCNGYFLSFHLGFNLYMLFKNYPPTHTHKLFKVNLAICVLTAVIRIIYGDDAMFHWLMGPIESTCFKTSPELNRP